MATPKTRWQDLQVYSLDGELLEGEERLAALAEYKARGCMRAWLEDPSDWNEDEDGPLEEAGPSVEEVDWTGFVTATAPRADWMVVGADGVASGTGLTEDAARAEAQRLADSSGRSWWIVREGDGQDEEGEEVAPTTRTPIRD